MVSLEKKIAHGNKDIVDFMIMDLFHFKMARKWNDIHTLDVKNINSLAVQALMCVSIFYLSNKIYFL